MSPSKQRDIKVLKGYFVCIIIQLNPAISKPSGEVKNSSKYREFEIAEFKLAGSNCNNKQNNFLLTLKEQELIVFHFVERFCIFLFKMLICFGAT